jgi:hypothetical protein
MYQVYSINIEHVYTVYDNEIIVPLHYPPRRVWKTVTQKVHTSGEREKKRVKCWPRREGEGKVSQVSCQRGSLRL